MERLEDLIVVGKAPDLVPGAGHAALFRPDPSHRQPPRPVAKGKPDADDRALWEWIKEFCGTTNWCDGDFIGGQPVPPTNRMIEAHLNARPEQWQDRLGALKLRRVVEHRRGGQALHLKPRRDRDTPAIILRLDADQHHGETDAKALIERIGATFFGGMLYHEPSRRGHAGYAVLDIAPYQQSINGETIHPSARRINQQIDAMQAALASLASAWGFKAKIEVNGRYMLKDWMDDGTCRVVSAGRWLRAPRCPGAGDVQRLVVSRFGDFVIHRIIGAAKGVVLPAPPCAQAPVTPKVTKPAPTLNRRLNTVAKLQGTGDKNRDRCRCVRRALRMLLGSPKSWPEALTVDQTDQVIDLANRLYEEAGLNGGARDAKRNAAFNGIIRWMLGNARQDQQAGDGAKGSDVRFDEADLARAKDLAASLIPAAKLDALNDAPACREAFRYIRIDHAQLALALCTIAKNSLVSGGDCPASAIAGMFTYFEVRWTNSTICTIVRLLREAGLIRYLDNGSYRPGERCRRYEPTNQTWSLPFIIHLKPDSTTAATASEQAARYMGTGEGRGPTQTFFVTSMKFSPFSPDAEDEGSEVTEPDYWASLAVLSAEICQN